MTSKKSAKLQESPVYNPCRCGTQLLALRGGVLFTSFSLVLILGWGRASVVEEEASPNCFILAYSTGFEREIGTEWSTKPVAVTPAGARRFLGLFGNDRVQLRLADLPVHSRARITFDLYLKDSWDGNDSELIGGPDRWSLAVDGGPTLLDTTFSLLPDFCNCQSYPDNYPDASYPGRTGAAENNTLGYRFQGRPMDAVYHLSSTFPHSSDAVVFNFLGNRTSLTVADESWGIDNVLVEVDVPGPPQILSAPQDKTAIVGSDVILSVTAAQAAGFQWQFQNATIAGATNARLLLTNVQPANAGFYSVVVSNCMGSVTSTPVQLTVVTKLPPTISRIADQTTLEDKATTPIALAVSDPETPTANLLVTATSSNPALVPSENIVLSGTGTGRTLVATPLHDQFGETTITVAVTDADGMQAGSAFRLTVLPVNDPPTLDPIPNLTIAENSPSQTVLLSGITAGPANEGQSLKITSASSNPALIANPLVSYTSPSATGSLSFTPALNASGTATITVTVQDDGGTANGGQDTLTRQFQVTAKPHVNIPPTVSINSPAEEEVFSEGTSLVVEASASDPDGTITKVEFFANSKSIGIATKSPFNLIWANVTAGDYVLIAVATDDTGATGTSAPVRVSVQADNGHKRVAVVQNFSDAEITKLQACLSDLELTSQVFNQEGLTFEALERFDLVIWDDLGTRENGLTANEVSIFERLLGKAVPLYFIGENLASSALNLGDAERTQWTGLIHLQASETFATAERVSLVERTHPVTNGPFGLVGDIARAASYDLAPRLANGEVLLATAGEANVLLAFEHPTLPVRTVTQNVLAFKGPKLNSIIQREKLFKNVVWWLLRLPPPPPFMNLDISVSETAGTPVANQPFVYEIKVRHGGELEASGVILTDTLPSNLRYQNAMASQGGCILEDGIVICQLGHLARAETATVQVSVLPSAEGSIANLCNVSANQPEAVTLDNTFSQILAVRADPNPPIHLGIGRVSATELDVIVEGVAGRSYRVETSTNLLDWVPVTNSTDSTLTLPLQPGSDGTSTREFLRVVIP